MTLIIRPVKYKSDMYRRWLLGEFGNRLRCWESLGDWFESGFRGNVGLRYKVPGSPFCKYDIPWENVHLVYGEFLDKGADHAKITIGEAAPDQHIMMQGEVMLSTRHYELHFSLHKAQMRDALKACPEWAHGIDAVVIMKHFMDPSSYNDIQEMLDTYQDHVIEFSCYSINLGDIPHRNTLIWEVRKY